MAANREGPSVWDKVIVYVTMGIIAAAALLTMFWR